ncbi:MAG: YceI family protein [Cytophagales bacterium]|nr:MAG: YceI family protein [Cytophagales bacterium]
MKKLNLLCAALLCAAILSSCGSGGSDTTSTADTTSVALDSAASAMGQELSIDTTQSTLAWEGKKSIAGKEEGHNGTIALQSGALQIEGGKLTGGSFTINMAAMKVLDLTDPKEQAKLISHLSTKDFFDVAQFPVAQFEITEVKEGAEIPDATHTITGNLTLKGVSKPVTFPAKVEGSGKNFSAQAALSIMRKDWGIAGSVIDKIFLKDNFDFKIQLKTIAQ